MWPRNSSANTCTRLWIRRLSPVGSAHFCPSVDPFARIKIDSRTWADAPSDSTSARSLVVSPVPNLQAGHCPQDSTYRNREYRCAARTMQAESSNAAKPADPRPLPTWRIESKSSGTSNSVGARTVFEEPGKNALKVLPSGGPPARSSTRYLRGVPSGSSNTPSCRTSPQTVKSIVPGEVSVPLDRSQSDPSARMWGMLASVSTLFTRVGLSFGGAANNPNMNGG